MYKHPVLIFTLFLVLPFISPAQTAGPNSPAANTEVPSLACLACPGADWTNPANAYALDHAYTIASPAAHGTCSSTNCFYSRTLELTNFGFAVPGTATINGIVVEINRNPAGVNTIQDSIIQLMQGPAPSGTNEAMPGTWAGSPVYYSYGSSTDLWGLSWTPATINSTAAGVAIKVVNVSASSATADIDHVRMTVYYTLTTGITSYQTSSPSVFSAFQDETGIQLTYSHIGSSGHTIVRLCDMTGKEVFVKDLGNAGDGRFTEHLEAGNLHNGIYFVQVGNDQEMVTHKLFISK